MRAAFVGTLQMCCAILRKRLIAPKTVSKKTPFLSHHTRERAQSNFIQLRRNSDQQFSAKYLMVRTI